MGRSRKAFLASAGALGASALATAGALAQSAPSASPKASPTPSPVAHDIALEMRAYDATLTDDQIDDIARQIDDGRKYAKYVRKSFPLRNGDEPTPEFEVRG